MYISVQHCGMGPHYRRPSPAWFCSNGIIRTKDMLWQVVCCQCSWWSTSTYSDSGRLSARCQNFTGYISCAWIVSCCHCGTDVELRCHSGIIVRQPLYRYTYSVEELDDLLWTC